MLDARCFNVWKGMVPLCIAAKKRMWKRFIQFNVRIKNKPTSSNKFSALKTKYHRLSYRQMKTK